MATCRTSTIAIITALTLTGCSAAPPAGQRPPAGAPGPATGVPADADTAAPEPPAAPAADPAVADAGASTAPDEPGGAPAEATSGVAACDTSAFLLSVNDVQRTDGHPDPELAVSCSEDALVVTSNNIIAYDFEQMTPNDLAAHEATFEIPLVPVAADEPGAMGLGAIGIGVDGVRLFAAFEAPRDGYRDPLADGLLDGCNGHTAPQGEYHHHARPDCVFDALGVDTAVPGLVYGYVWDGYEIVSPYVEEDGVVRAVTSSYQHTGDGLGAFEDFTYVAGSGDLDACNGMVDPDGVYRYHATDTFPYLPFCYHGVTDRAQGVFDGTAPAGGPPA